MPVETTLVNVTDTEYPKTLSLSELLLQSSALEGEHVDDDSEHSAHNKIVFPVEIARANTVDM